MMSALCTPASRPPPTTIAATTDLVGTPEEGVNLRRATSAGAMTRADRRRAHTRIAAQPVGMAAAAAAAAADMIARPPTTATVAAAVPAAAAVAVMTVEAAGDHMAAVDMTRLLLVGGVILIDLLPLTTIVVMPTAMPRCHHESLRGTMGMRGSGAVAARVDRCATALGMMTGALAVVADMRAVTRVRARIETVRTADSARYFVGTRVAHWSSQGMLYECQGGETTECVRWLLNVGGNGRQFYSDVCENPGLQLWLFVVSRTDNFWQ